MGSLLLTTLSTNGALTLSSWAGQSRRILDAYDVWHSSKTSPEELIFHFLQKLRSDDLLEKGAQYF